jgi:hypothetical protein
MMVTDMLEELGFSVVAQAGNVDDPIRLAQSTECDSPSSTSISTVRKSPQSPT